MIETFIIDWPVLVLIGVLFGAFAPTTEWWKSRAFMAGLVTAAVFTSTAIVSYFIEPDWMWMYFLDPDDVAWVVPLIPVGYILTFVLGFAAALTFRAMGTAFVWGAGIAAAVCEIVVVAVTWDRYHLVGSRSEWVRDAANELFTASPSGSVKTIGLLGPVFIAVLVVSLILVRRSARSTPADR
ncbi:MAG: hypothetical protein M3280_03500 [Actinomycetota bacterium]|nr:hypothetical protein [Actinomycetota bacterium]